MSFDTVDPLWFMSSKKKASVSFDDESKLLALLISAVGQVIFIFDNLGIFIYHLHR